MKKFGLINVAYFLYFFCGNVAEIRLVLISFDGFRHDYLNRSKLPNLKSIINNGVTAPYLINTFATKTLVNHFTAVTGVSAKSHGIVNNVLYDQNLQKELSAKDELFWQWGSRQDPPKLLPIWSANEKLAGKYSGSSMWPGSTFVNKPTYDLPFNLSIPWVERIEHALTWMANPQKNATFVSMYFEEPDATAHIYGPDSPEVTKMIEMADETTGYIIRRLEELALLNDVNIIVTSDHGFTSVTPEKLINISAIVDPSLYNFYGDTPVMHVLPKTGMEDYVYESFRNASVDHNFTAYRSTELPKEWKYFNPDRTLPIVLVADEGYVFDDFEKTMEWMEAKYNRTRIPENVYGMHGYDSRLSSMHPFFVAQGPQLKVNFTAKPFHTVDLYPLMCHLLGILDVPPNEGKLERVAALLRDPYDLRQYEFTIMLAVGVMVMAAFLASLVTLFWISCTSRPKPVSVYVESKSPKKASLSEAKEQIEIERLLYVKQLEEV